MKVSSSDTLLFTCRQLMKEELTSPCFPLSLDCLAEGRGGARGADEAFSRGVAATLGELPSDQCRMAHHQQLQPGH